VKGVDGGVKVPALQDRRVLEARNLYNNKLFSQVFQCCLLTIEVQDFWHIKTTILQGLAWICIYQTCKNLTSGKCTS